MNITYACHAYLWFPMSGLVSGLAKHSFSDGAINGIGSHKVLDEE